MTTPAVEQKCFIRISSLVLIVFILTAFPALAGPYRDSAHGNASFGVNRTALDTKYAFYAVGNCAHCHEMHASIDGIDPGPVTGPMPHTLFADSFNSGRTENPYLETDNFCFYCHSDSYGQQVINRNYSVTFGGGNIASGPQSILTAFNQTSYHNLYDIWNYLSTDPAFAPWFAARGNPCSACHDSHRAKRNWDSAQAGFPLLSAISLPNGSGNLWGETELMSDYFGYQAPYAFAPALEPAGVGVQDGSNTPDYVTFCTTCHTPDANIPSTTLLRDVKKINWGVTGLGQDKHGELSRNGSDHFREPYATAATGNSNFLLSCMDCHEAHGSENILLLRTRINGEDQEETVISTDALSQNCKRWHLDDLAAAAGTGQADRWEFVHHGAADAPYAQGMCSTCHGAGGGNTPIACGNCHGHGMDDSWLGANATGRKTF